MLARKSYFGCSTRVRKIGELNASHFDNLHFWLHDLFAANEQKK
jgi:hypothetical protein